MIENFSCLIQIIMLKKGRLGGNIKILHKTRVKQIDHFLLFENKIFSESMLCIPQKFQHFLLGKGGEKQTEIFFIIPVKSRKNCIKLMIGHNGERSGHIIGFFDQAVDGRL